MMRVAALIRHGKLCRHCSNKECVDLGTDTEPIELECPECNGSGCTECAQGTIRVIGCPNKYCRPIADAVALCDLYKQGLPPVSGGALDQSVWFVDAQKFLEHDELMIRSEDLNG